MYILMVAMLSCEDISHSISGSVNHDGKEREEGPEAVVWSSKEFECSHLIRGYWKKKALLCLPCSVRTS